MHFGNFISAQTQAHTKDNAILNIQITKNGATGEISIDKIDYVPVYVYDKGTSVKNRYELIDIRSAMRQYESGDTSKVGAGLYKTLKSELEDIEKVLGEPIDNTIVETQEDQEITNTISNGGGGGE